MFENYEDFTEPQVEILKKYVTSTTSNIFVLRNLPEVIKGALFSRYSRSSLGLRSLLLKEFILGEETAFTHIVGKNEGAEDSENQLVAIKKAQNFYDRILDGYGDDSIGELGGAHLALENISMIAAKAVEDCRIGGSPLEKSTRYIYFDQKVDGEYLFYREPILLTSAYKDLYVKTCNMLFETYSDLIAPMTEFIEKTFPKDPEISKTAYTAALRAKVLDCLRGLLPASALTNMGVFGNGRFFETLLQKLHSHTLSELQEMGKKGHSELAKVIPSFIRRAETSHRHYLAYADYMESMRQEFISLSAKDSAELSSMKGAGVRLIDYDPDCMYKVAASLLFSHSQAGLLELEEYCQRIAKEDLEFILEGAAQYRKNRREKSPRALERASFTFEITADFGIYRDLQRHRILTQERQLLTCNHGFYTPPEIIGTELEGQYKAALHKAAEAYGVIAAELPEEAQYVVPMAFNMNWYFTINLRSLQWLTELRSAPAGHPGYRFIAQEMAKQVIAVLPSCERFFKFVDYEGYELGRLGQEVRIVEKMKARRES